MWNGMTPAALTLFLWILLQLVILPFSKTPARFLLICKLYGISLISYLLLERTAPSQTGFLQGLILHILFFLVYISFYYSVERSVALRFLIEILKAPQGLLALQEIQLKYGLKYMIERRLKSLQDNGYIQEKRGRFFLTPKGTLLAVFFKRGSRLFGKRGNGRGCRSHFKK